MEVWDHAPITGRTIERPLHADNPAASLPPATAEPSRAPLSESHEALT